MKLIDVNVLLYVINVDDPQHAKVLAWWKTAVASNDVIGISWSVAKGFLRLATHRRVFLRPQSPEDAVARLDEWLAQPNIHLVPETDSHWKILRQLIVEMGISGDLITDAHLAALAISRGATLVSCDRDFARFRQLRWENPAA